MPDTGKRAEYLLRAEQARAAAAESSSDVLKMVLYSIARLWERLGRTAKGIIVAGVPATAACAVWMSECCVQMHRHFPCCVFGI